MNWRVWSTPSFRLSILLFSLCIGIVQAESINLDSITQQAIEQSFTLKIAQVDIKISNTDIKAARADYFPTIRGNLNIERLKSFQDPHLPVVAVGNTVLPIGSRFQNSLGLNAQQVVFDFGRRNRKVKMAKHDTVAKMAVYRQALRDLRLKLVDLYADALTAYREIQANEAILKLSQSGYQLKKRLYQAGSHSKVEVADEAIQVAQALDNIQTHRDELSEKLQGITYYTHEPYKPEETELADFSEADEPNNIAFQVAQSPEARQYESLIAQKQAEIEMLRRQYLPQLSLYSYYNFYGYDPEQWSKAVTNFSQRTISLGVNVNLPIFDGFKNQAAIEKAKLEQEKLRLQKAEKLAQLQQQADLYQTQVKGKVVQLKTKATVINTTQEKLTLVTRLTDKQIVDQTQTVKEQIARVQKQVEAEKILIQQLAALKKLKIMAEG